MSAIPEDLKNKPVIIHWKRWRKKRELAVYPLFRIQGLMSISGEGWLMLQPCNELAMYFENTPPVWVRTADIDWIAETVLVSKTTGAVIKT